MKNTINLINIQPRMLNRTQAAAYTGRTIAQFMRDCPVIPDRSSGSCLYDIRQIDEWIDGLIGAGDGSHGMLSTQIERALEIM